jgi:hypothetical protein
MTAVALGANGYLSTGIQLRTAAMPGAIDYFAAGRIEPAFHSYGDHGGDARGQHDADRIGASRQRRHAGFGNGRDGPVQTLCTAARRRTHRAAPRTKRRRAPLQSSRINHGLTASGHCREMACGLARPEKSDLAHPYILIVLKFWSDGMDPALTF